MIAKMTYTLGTNFDTKVIDAIDKYDTEKTITSLFGKLRRDMLGGGRPSYILPNITLKELANYIKHCHEKGLEFNYLYNAACMSNMEYEKAGHRKILDFTSKLIDVGVDAIATNSVYLCEVLKKKYPQLKITVGIFARVSSLEHIRRWENNGADEVTLVPSLNRNFKLLEKILTYTKRSGISVRLIANNICVRSCHMRRNHASMLSHASQNGQKKDKTLFDYALLNCTIRKIKYPTQLIAAEWIRPEDIGYYEKICEKTGNNNLSIKLVERTKHTEFLERVIKAYVSRSYDGNLLDICAWPSIKAIKQKHKFQIISGAITGGYNIQNVNNIIKLFNLPDMYIDNKKLDKFIEKFVKDYSCDTSLCNIEDDTDGFAACSYCKKWADKAITFSKEKINEWLAKADSALEAFHDSSFFG